MNTKELEPLNVLNALVLGVCSGRPSAGGQLTAWFSRTRAIASYLFICAAFRQTGCMKNRSVFLEALAPPTSKLPQTRTTESQQAVRPNPSIERTSTGLAHFAPQVYVPLRGPSRSRPAHVKRWAS
jgi:hypothetical protein